MLFAIIRSLAIHLHYALKITKIYVKNNTSKNTSSNEIKDSFVKHYQIHFIKLFSHF